MCSTVDEAVHASQSTIKRKDQHSYILRITYQADHNNDCTAKQISGSGEAFIRTTQRGSKPSNVGRFNTIQEDSTAGGPFTLGRILVLISDTDIETFMSQRRTAGYISGFHTGWGPSVH